MCKPHPTPPSRAATAMRQHPQPLFPRKDQTNPPSIPPTHTPTHPHTRTRIYTYIYRYIYIYHTYLRVIEHQRRTLRCPNIEIRPCLGQVFFPHKDRKERPALVRLGGGGEGLELLVDVGGFWEVRSVACLCVSCVPFSSVHSYHTYTRMCAHVSPL